MADKIFDTILECGCMISHDSGYPDEIIGDSGLIGCCADYIKNQDEREKALSLCTHSWEKHYEECGFRFRKGL